MKLIVISTPDFRTNEESVINSLFESGLERFHLRKPDSTEIQIREFLDRINPEYHHLITLHEHFGLYQEYNIGGIHLNRRNSTIPHGFYGAVSESCHGLTEISTKKSKREYLFLSPVFNSISKKGYTSGFSLEELSEAHENGIIDSKVIALGGIGKDNIRIAEKVGFGGVAVLGYLWDIPQPGSKDEYLRIFNSLMNECK